MTENLQKMLHQREKQLPVFKPLSNNENANAFNLETSVPRVRMPISSTSRSNDMQLTNTIQRQTSNQDQTTGTERLSSLHAKLHQEADKIRKWKIQTEIDLKQKEKKIHEASGTIESLRKSIWEFQLQNEKLSLTLQDEMNNREVTTQKILATRELCNVLKDHTMKLEERLMQCETERTELKYVGKEHSKQFEELSAKFKDLQITAINNQNSLVKQLQLENEDRNNLEDKMAMKLGDAENQLKELMDKCDEKDIEIRNVRTIMQKNADKIYTMEQTVEQLQKKINEQIFDLEEKQKLFDESTAELTSIKEHRGSLETQLSSICHELSEMKEAKLNLEQAMLTTQNQHEVTLAEKHNEIEMLSTTLEQEKTRNTDFERQLSESSTVCENLKSSRDILIIEKTELENKTVDMQNSLDHMKEQYESMSQNMNKLRDEYTKIEKELLENKQTCQHLKNQISQLEKLVHEKEDENSIQQDKLTSLNTLLEKYMDKLQKATEQHKYTENQFTKLQEDMNNVTEALNVEKKNAQALSSNYTSVNKELESKEKQMIQKEKDLGNMKKENEKITKECKHVKENLASLKTEITELSNEKESLLEKVAELEVENSMLMEEREEVDLSLNKEIKSKTQKMTDLEIKLRELKSEATNKNKQIKESEKEIKSLKNKLASRVKASEEKDGIENMLKEELENMKIANEELEQNLNTANEAFEREHTSADEAKRKVIDMERNVEMALKEKQDAIQKCDLQFAQMMATLEKYKQENQKIVSQKEKELELLRSKADELSAFKQKTNKDIEDWKKEAENWKKEAEYIKRVCQQEQMEKNHLIEEVNKQKKAITTLEKDLSTKKTEIKSLKKRTKAENICCNNETQIDKSLESLSSEKNAVLQGSKKAVTPSRAPLQEIPQTPLLNIMKTPQSEPKSAQRSILKNVSSISKRRKVAFTRLYDSGRNSASDTDSSSELMEIESADIDNHFKNKSLSTPIHIRPSSKHKKEKSHRSTPTKELQSFKELYPDKSEIFSDKPTQIQKENLRKTPNKFFKDRVSHKMKSPKINKAQESEDLAWFDLDSVFGFGDED